MFFLAKPKSPILTTPLLSMILAGLRSLNNLRVTCERFPPWRVRWSHCKFVSKRRWLPAMWSICVFRCNVRDLSHRSPVWYSSCGYSPSRLAPLPRFRSSIIARSAPRKRALTWGSHLDRLYVVSITETFLEDLDSAWLLGAVLLAAIHLNKMVETLPYEPFPRTYFMKTT